MVQITIKLGRLSFGIYIRRSEKCKFTSYKISLENSPKSVSSNVVTSVTDLAINTVPATVSVSLTIIDHDPSPCSSYRYHRPKNMENGAVNDNSFNNAVPECPICLDPLGLDTVVLACGHTICRGCNEVLATEEDVYLDRLGAW